VLSVFIICWCKSCPLSPQVKAQEKKAALEAASIDGFEDNLDDWRSLVGGNVKLAAPYLKACDTDDTITKAPPGQGMLCCLQITTLHSSWRWPSPGRDLSRDHGVGLFIMAVGCLMVVIVYLIWTYRMSGVLSQLVFNTVVASSKWIAVITREEFQVCPLLLSQSITIIHFSCCCRSRTLQTNFGTLPWSAVSCRTIARIRPLLLTLKNSTVVSSQLSPGSPGLVVSF
jgi:hypothetical protein